MVSLSTFGPKSLRAKIVIAGLILVAVIAALVTILYSSSSQYERQLQRISVAHNVLSGFQSISDHAYRKLNAMGQIGSQGSVDDVAARVANERRLWEAVSTTRDYLNEEKGLSDDAEHASKLARLEQIEGIVAQIIEGGSTIRDAVSGGQVSVVEASLANLRSPDIAGEFNRLIDEAIAGERAVVSASQAEATRLSEFINSALSGAMLVTLVVGLIATLTISRSLTRSLTSLESAAEAYTSGDLTRRSFESTDAEFGQVGDAFNRMAQELAARRAEAQESQESLELQVVERTRELAHTLQQLELVDARRRQFLADISHEIRTPLTLIQGEADVVLRGGPKTDEEYEEAISRIKEQVVHTTRLVKDLLLVARSEEGNLRLERRPIVLVDLIEDVCADFRNAMHKHGLKMEKSYPEDSPSVTGDANRLRQVFAILLDNAVRYSAKDHALRIDVVNDEQAITVTVVNKGEMLSAREVSQAFDRFFRGDNATQRSEGSGLGLPVAKAIVEAHNGTIELISEGEETAVRVHLPVEIKELAA